MSATQTVPDATPFAQVTATVTFTPEQRHQILGDLGQATDQGTVAERLRDVLALNRDWSAFLHVDVSCRAGDAADSGGVPDRPEPAAAERAYRTLIDVHTTLSVSEWDADTYDAVFTAINATIVDLDLSEATATATVTLCATEPERARSELVAAVTAGTLDTFFTWLRPQPVVTVTLIDADTTT